MAQPWEKRIIDARLTTLNRVPMNVGGAAGDGGTTQLWPKSSGSDRGIVIDPVARPCLAKWMNVTLHRCHTLGPRDPPVGRTAA